MRIKEIQTISMDVAQTVVQMEEELFEDLQIASVTLEGNRLSVH